MVHIGTVGGYSDVGPHGDAVPHDDAATNRDAAPRKKGDKAQRKERIIYDTIEVLPPLGVSP